MHIMYNVSPVPLVIGIIHIEYIPEAGCCAKGFIKFTMQMGGKTFIHSLTNWR